jgi:hypothetical protein
MLAAAAQANVNLEWRTDAETVCVGDTVSVGLYAVSDDPVENQLVAAIQMVFAWDNDALQLLGLDETGSVPLLSSGFPFPDVHGLNEEAIPQDGNGFYLALALLGTPIVATPDGVLITMFQFLAMSDEVPPAPIEILESGGDPPAETIVFDGTIPNFDVTGTLGSIDIVVRDACSGDVNCDGVVDVLDLIDVILAWGLCPDPPATCREDIVEDGLVNVLDLIQVILSWGPCP